MEHPGFFERVGPFSLRVIASSIGAELGADADPERELKDVRPLDGAGEGDLSFVDNPKYLPALSKTHASVCIVPPKFVRKLPGGTTGLVMPEPYRGFAKATALFYPDSLIAKTAGAPGAGVWQTAFINHALSRERWSWSSPCSSHATRTGGSVSERPGGPGRWGRCAAWR